MILVMAIPLTAITVMMEEALISLHMNQILHQVLLFFTLTTLAVTAIFLQEILPRVLLVHSLLQA
ncbi:MAG: hypothetical protein HOG19_08675 [Gammaproteobacteria bacterium]|nr:hypothetical protein [Gammaproteobacteria bacterium]